MLLPRSFQCSVCYFKQNRIHYYCIQGYGCWYKKKLRIWYYILTFFDNTYQVHKLLSFLKWWHIPNIRYTVACLQVGAALVQIGDSVRLGPFTSSVYALIETFRSTFFIPDYLYSLVINVSNCILGVIT